MPDSADFLQAFGLVNHLQFDLNPDDATEPQQQVEIFNVSSKHQIIKRFQSYVFRIVLNLQIPLSGNHSKKPNPNDVLQALERYMHVDQSQVVNSRYGNPYLCVVSDVSIKSREGMDLNGSKHAYYSVQLTGHAERIR